LSKFPKLRNETDIIHVDMFDDEKEVFEADHYKDAPQLGRENMSDVEKAESYWSLLTSKEKTDLLVHNVEEVLDCLSDWCEKNFPGKGIEVDISGGNIALSKFQNTDIILRIPFSDD